MAASQTAVVNVQNGGLSHPEWEAKGSVVGLETHWSPLLQDGLVGCMQPFTNGWGRVVIVVMVTRGRVVIIIVVHGLVGIVVLLLPEKVGVEVSVETKRSGQSVTNSQYENILNLVFKLDLQ